MVFWKSYVCCPNCKGNKKAWAYTYNVSKGYVCKFCGFNYKHDDSYVEGNGKQQMHNGKLECSPEVLVLANKAKESGDSNLIASLSKYCTIEPNNKKEKESE